MFHSLLILLAALQAFGATAPSCRAGPGDADWPSLDMWAALNTSVDGRLLRPVPPAAACHPDHPAYNASQCAVVQWSWQSEFFHVNDPVSVEWNNWSNDTCLPYAGYPCSSAGYPVYVLNATTAEHVRAGLIFAKKNNIRVIVKNSGHDYIGRSSGGSSLSIWVRHMQGIRIHETSFSPKGCNFAVDGGAITAAAGTQMMDAYAATAPYNRTVVGGNGRTVALGGFITGAGHSILAPHYGLAVDQVLEVDLVTPTGDILTVNECQNQDLFWAVRGGGGSTFGVLTSVTMKTIPSPRIMNLNFGIQTYSTNAAAWDAITYILGRFPTLAEAGISGYPSILNAVPNPLGGGWTRVTGMAGKVIMLNTSNPVDILRPFQAIFAEVDARWPGQFAIVTATKGYENFGEWYAENYDSSPAGLENVVASRLLAPDTLTANATAVKTAFQKFAAGGQANAFIVSGKGVWNAQGRGGGNAACPAWRKALVHCTVTVQFAPLDMDIRKQAIATADYFAAGLRELSPDTGAYMNEANKYEPNWQQTFWGENYGRLLQIKRAVDPDDTLWCSPCVGSEGWHEVDGKLCRTSP